MIDPHIFRAYDIRGKAHAQITEEASKKIGQAFGTVLRRMYKKEHPTVILGWDARTHSPQFAEAMQQGLMQSGCRVLRIGQTPSPVNYFTICERKTDGGVQITASHNPKDDNGIKLQVRDAEAHSGDDLQRLREQIEAEDFMDGEGSAEDIDAITPYLQHMQKQFGSIGKGMTVVVDAGNGVAGPANAEAIRQTGADVIGLYLEPDGNFPNHQPDPSKRDTLKDLQKEVKAKKASIGFAFDGDGDRVGLVDEKGEIRSADEILLLLAQDHLSRHKGAPVIFTVSNSETLNTEITQWGGRPVMCKVGHSYVEHAMREEHALLGGEQSGHFFCGEGYYGFDDALVAALHILRIVSKSGKTVSELMSNFPKVYQAHELRPHCEDSAKTKVIESITAHFAQSYPVNTLDGARIDFGEGAWAGIRQSNTSPCLSICMEARSEGKLKEMEGVVLEHLKGYSEVTM
jgi:phosphomannomutase/phosphoglucomutase